MVLANAGVDPEQYKRGACPYRQFSRLAAGPAKQHLQRSTRKMSDIILTRFVGWVSSQ